MAKRVGFFVMWLVFAAIIALFWTSWYDVQREQMPVRTEIEQAIEAEVDNQFVVIKGIGFGGAGAGGIAVPQVTLVDIEEFLARAEEDIFVHLEEVHADGTKRTPLVGIDKVYSSFPEEGILVQYRTCHRLEGFRVESYDPHEILFIKENITAVIMATFGIVLLGTFVTLGTSGTVDPY